MRPRSETAEWLRAQGVAHIAGVVVLGSGWAPLADRVDVLGRWACSDVPGASATSVAGHPGEIVWGRWCGTPVLLFVGRWHGYEGCTAQEVVLPVNVAVDLGSEWLLCTNAAGAVSPLVDVGQLVAITDDLETSSSSCLEALRCNGGPSDRLAARDELAIGRPTYSPRLLAALSEAATEANVHLGRGVLAMMTGPNYETPAEVRMLLRTGATVVSMSTVPEARYAVRLGLDVAAISCVTNRAPTYPGAHVTHEEVLVACRRAQGDAAALMEKWMRHDLVARAHGAP